MQDQVLEDVSEQDMVKEFQPQEPVQEFSPPELDLGLIEHEIPNPVKRPPKIKLSQIRKK